MVAVGELTNVDPNDIASDEFEILNTSNGYIVAGPYGQGANGRSSLRGRCWLDLRSIRVGACDGGWVQGVSGDGPNSTEVGGGGVQQGRICILAPPDVAAADGFVSGVKI